MCSLEKEVNKYRSTLLSKFPKFYEGVYLALLKINDGSKTSLIFVTSDGCIK